MNLRERCLDALRAIRPELRAFEAVLYGPNPDGPGMVEVDRKWVRLNDDGTFTFSEKAFDI